MDRRDFMLAASGFLATSAVAANAKRLAPTQPKWGIQLFTVLAQLEQDFEGTIKKVAKIGYQEVETIGAFGRNPAHLRQMLDTYGLTSPSQHIASDQLYASFSAWARREMTMEGIHQAYVAGLNLETALPVVENAIKQAHVLGQKNIVWPILFDEQLASREILDSYLKLFNKAGELCRREGVTFTYHNHDREFSKLGNEVIYDIILKQTDPAAVAMEMDFYWVRKGGADPFAYLASYPGRFTMAHVKDMAADGDFAVVGKGVLPIAKLIGKAKQAGIKHFFVEFDRSSDPILSVTESFAFLKTMPRR